MLRLFLATSFFLVSGWAQETAEITGRIVDASGSVTPNASIEILNVNTNAKWVVNNNADGPLSCASASIHDTAVSTVSHGRQTCRFGISRSAAACSTD